MIVAFLFLLLKDYIVCQGASQAALVVKKKKKYPPVNAGDIRDESLISGLERSPGEGSGNPLRYSRLENPTDREAWQATVHGVTKSRTRLKRLSSSTSYVKMRFCS